MRRPASTFALVVATELFLAAAPQQHPEVGRPPDKGEFIRMRGCVNGSLLTAVESSPATVAGTLTRSNRFRMAGPKEIRTQLEKANRKMVEVTGRIKTGNNLRQGQEVGQEHLCHRHHARHPLANGAGF